ncbi:MAG TPA: hypothetical protein VGW34_01370 [Allosphingosinicella sp.]|nr:hypothetical protein [Allosphingosinicella sp.]
MAGSWFIPDRGAAAAMRARLAVVGAAAAALVGLLSLYESRVLGLFPFGEVPPAFTP